jgi:hypothetical protein
MFVFPIMQLSDQSGSVTLLLCTLGVSGSNVLDCDNRAYPHLVNDRVLELRACHLQGLLTFIEDGSSFFLEKTPWFESASELYRPSDRRLSAK